MKKITLFLITLTYFSCEPNWKFKVIEEAPRLVVYGYIQPSKVVSVTVSQSVAPLDNTTDRIITDAEVILFENDIAIDTLEHTENGVYTSLNDFKPSVGQTYFIQVSKTGFPTLKSKADTVPEAPIISGYEAIDSIQDTGPWSQEVVSQIIIDFNENNNPTDFIGYYATIPTLDNGGSFNDVIEREDCYWINWTMENVFYFKNICLPVSNQLILESRDYTKNELQTAEVQLCQATSNAIVYHQKLNNLISDADAGNGTNLFYEPTLLPQMVENGYGYFGACNCTTIDVNF